MNLRRLFIIAAAAIAFLAGTVLSASAVIVGSPGTTTATFSLSGGDLTLSVPAGATLTNASTSVDAFTITGSLGAMSVTDARGGIAGWVVSGASTTFTGPGSSASMAVKYSPLSIVETGTSSVAAAVVDTVISSTTTLLTATEVSGNNTASWSPGLKVDMPAGARAGAYSGTVTTSIV
jgi:hypothetical protein